MRAINNACFNQRGHYRVFDVRLTEYKDYTGFES